MKHFLHILLGILLFGGVRVSAQTPYDSFSPETTRPMVMREALQSNCRPQTDFAATDTIPCVAVIDLERKALLLVDLRSNTILGVAPLTDEIQKWLSVDPLTDKNISTSPYMYCNGNPIRFVDPDGRFSLENIEGESDYKTILVLPSDIVLGEMKNKDKKAFQETYEQALSKKMPIMRVDNAEDYANAMEALEEMNSNTDSYVLSTSHGSRNGTRLMIGSDKFTNMEGDFSQFREGLSGKTVFITACRLAAKESGVRLIERFAKATGSTVIGAKYTVPALLGGFCGGTLSRSPFRNAVWGLFGGSFENSFILTNGVNSNTIHSVTIDKDRGISW